MNGTSHNGVLRPGGMFSGRLFPVLVAFGAMLASALVIGYASSGSNFTRLVALLLALAFSAAAIKWPNWGLIVLLVLTSTITAPEFFRPYTHPNNVYYAIELLMVLIVVGALFSRPAGEESAGVFQRIYASPVSIVITFFMAIVMLKVLTILIEYRLGGGQLGQMYTFNRGLSMYLLFFPVLLLMNTRAKQRWFIKVIYVLAAIIMARVLLELIFPDWQIWQTISVSQPLADETPSVDQAVQRLRAPGGTFELAVFWIGLMNIILRKWTWKHLAFYIPLTLVMLIGILLEFNRSYVIPMMGLLVVALFLNKKMVRVKLFAILGSAAVVLALVFTFTGQLDKYVDAAMVRYGSAFSSQTLESQSVLSREIEQNYAWQAIEREPLLGIGLDELYRPPIPGMLDNLRWYIHNSYMWIWTYFGIIGLTAFLAIMATAILRTIFNWQKIRDPLLQAAVLGCAFSIVTLLAANFAAPKFYDLATVPVIAVMLGLIEAIIISSRRENDVG